MTAGKIMLVGIGPGSTEHMTARARAAIAEADTIIGYVTYIKLVADLIEGKEIIRKSMTEELDRAIEALERAREGKKVALISSGDAGVYGMAGPTFEVLFQAGWTPPAVDDNGVPEAGGIVVEVVPGASALNSCAALVGAPLTHDFCAISLSDLPTPYALHLAEPVVYALNALQSALTHRDAFNPQTSKRTFNLAMTDIGEMYFMPPLMNALAQRAPHIQISTVRPHAGNLKEDMESGVVDLAAGPLPDLQTGFFQPRLLRHRSVCMFRRNHPLARSPMGLEQFCALDHVGVLSANTGHGDIDGLMERAGIKRHMRLRVPHFVAVGPILQNTDLIATVPERFSERIEGPFGLASSPHPVRLPDIAINLFWHAKYNRDPANLWLRQLMVELFADGPTRRRPRGAAGQLT